MRRFFLAMTLVFGFGLAVADEKEGGIIGTGVVGEVTGLEAFEVAGMRFNLPETAEIEGIGSLEDLRMGMTLSLRAARDGDGWQAVQLRRLPVLVGPVTGEGEVMGVPVVGKFPGEGTVIIDGFWSSGGIVATRVTATKRVDNRVMGRYDPSGFVGAVALASDRPIDAAPGEIVVVAGRYDAGLFTVTEVERGVFDGSVPDLLLAEGFLDSPDHQGDAMLYSVDAKLAAGDDLAVLEHRIRRCALHGQLDYDEAALSAEDAKTVQDFCVSAVR